ncbi:MAG TPA: FtsX-like permease family protein, partial [Lachnospiraceae bacterium]|nr:FtsX-like permease family protein [Lachnospiraceae bacterium]
LDENAKKLSYAKDELDRNTDGLQNQVQAFGLSKHSTQYENVESELEKASEELTKNQKQWDEANQEYTESLETFQKKISDAEAKIQDAKDTLASMEKPKWIIFDRNTAVAGFSEMKDITETVSSIAKIFPLFFILIVLLMTSNTMARMIVEERGELGTLTSLGFKDRSIISTYLLYVLSATVLGAATGYIIGCNVIPHIIYLCLPYSMPSLVIHYNVESFLIIILVVIALMSTVTILFCNHELKNNPSTLMRPIPPKNGKTILLERISFIWNRLSFTWKVTIRNMFRYKQRVLMTIVGVAGCTALLLTGFGVRDSINGIAEKQYGEILRYNALIVLKNETQTITNDMMDLLEKEQIQEPSLIHQSAVTCELKDKSLNTYLIVPEKEENFYKYFNLKSDRNGDNLKLSDEGVIISQKLSEVYKIGKGDQIEVKDSDNNSFTMPVLDVTENYMQNYIYISKNLYEKVFSETPQYNMIVSDFTGDGKIVSKHLMDSGLVANVTYKADILKKAVESNKSLNNVVLLLVCISSILAVIVLYNLTSINISERKREIATLKVL